VALLRPETRVLYISGYTDDAVVRNGVFADNVQFLHKPFTPAILANKVREVLDQKRAPQGLTAAVPVA
jgi:two-component system cell cycle sensor histidine kinase/response regulator CckA